MSATTLLNPDLPARRGDLRSFDLSAAWDIVLGTELLVFTGWISGFLVRDPLLADDAAVLTALRLLGAVTLLTGLETLLFARSRLVWLRRMLVLVPVLHVVWVAACVAMLAAWGDLLTQGGARLIVATALVSLVFAGFQFHALRR